MLAVLVDRIHVVVTNLTVQDMCMQSFNVKRKKTRHILNITDDVSLSGYCAIVSVGLL